MLNRSYEHHRGAIGNPKDRVQHDQSFMKMTMTISFLLTIDHGLQEAHMNNHFYSHNNERFPAQDLNLVSDAETFYQLNQVSESGLCTAITAGAPRRAETGRYKLEQLLSWTAHPLKTFQSACKISRIDTHFMSKVSSSNMVRIRITKKEKKKSRSKSRSRSSSVQEVIEVDSTRISTPTPTRAFARRQRRAKQAALRPTRGPHRDEDADYSPPRRHSVSRDRPPVASDRQFRSRSPRVARPFRTRSPRATPGPRSENFTPRNPEWYSTGFKHRTRSPSSRRTRRSPTPRTRDRRSRSQTREPELNTEVLITPLCNDPPTASSSSSSSSSSDSSGSESSSDSSSTSLSDCVEIPLPDPFVEVDPEHPSGRELRREKATKHNAATVGQFPQPKGRLVRLENIACGYTGGFRPNMEKLFLTQLSRSQGPDWPLPTGPPPTEEHLTECEEIKRLHQLLPGCTKAMFTEEMLGLSIITRIRAYAQGRLRILGLRRNHGQRMVGDQRSNSERAGAVVRDTRLDFLRLAGLMDRGPVEAIALTYHSHLFDQGGLLVEAGGIPGCPESLTDLQVEDCKEGAADIMNFMMELHRCRMEHHGSAMPVENSNNNMQYSRKDILIAAGEMGRDCANPVTPQYTVTLINHLFGEKKTDEDTLMEEINEVLEIAPAPVPQRVPVMPPVEVLPYAHCVRARSFVKDPPTQGLECKNETCTIGSKFIRELHATDHLRPDDPAYDKISLGEAGSRSSMRTGPHDLRREADENRLCWHLDALADLNGIRAQMVKADFITSIRRTGMMTAGSEDWVKGDLGRPEEQPQRGEKSKVLANPPLLNKPFTALHFGSPNGALLVVHCNFDGHSYQGRKVPDEIKALLADKDIMVVQFNMDTLLERLCAGGIPMCNWIDARNLALAAYPQPHIDKCRNMRDGRHFVASQLDAPSRFFIVQVRENLARKGRVKASRRGPPEPYLPRGIPDYRTETPGVPMYTEEERRLRRTHWNSVKNDLDIPLDLACDDFSQTGNLWNPRMMLFVFHDHSISYALMFRMAYRMAILHHVSSDGDALRFVHYVLLAARNVDSLKRAPNPVETRLRAGGKVDWMVTNSVRLDEPFRAHPFFYTDGLSSHTSTRIIANIIGTRLHRYAIDVMGLTLGFREGLEQIHGGKLTEVSMSRLLDARFVRDKKSPHCCPTCASGDHLEDECTVKDARCIYPRCLEHGHVLAVCPVLLARCPLCQRLGHRQTHCKSIPWIILMNDFKAGAPFHRMGIFATERLSASMYLEDGDKSKLVVLPKVDYEKRTYVTFWDRFRLSILPYELPF
jgi:hypothetical protein